MCVRTKPIINLFLFLMLIQGCGIRRVDGHKEAENDISAGKLQLMVDGHRRNDHEIFSRILRERYGVRLIFPPYEARSSREHQTLKSYNDRMEVEITKRYGANAIQAASEDATQESLKRARKH